MPATARSAESSLCLRTPSENDGSRIILERRWSVYAAKNLIAVSYQQVGWIFLNTQNQSYSDARFLPSVCVRDPLSDVPARSEPEPTQLSAYEMFRIAIALGGQLT